MESRISRDPLAKCDAVDDDCAPGGERVPYQRISLKAVDAAQPARAAMMMAEMP
jgi:hypothetical protein